MFSGASYAQVSGISEQTPARSTSLKTEAAVMILLLLLLFFCFAVLVLLPDFIIFLIVQMCITVSNLI